MTEPAGHGSASETARNLLPGVLREMKRFFDRSTACLTEEDSEFAPARGMYTVAQHVAHVALTIDWMTRGAFSEEGFSLDFEEPDRMVGSVRSLEQARHWLALAVDRAVESFGGASAEMLQSPLPDGPILPGAPRHAVVPALCDHTAHHRGALTVYARLRGKTPAIPYVD